MNTLFENIDGFFIGCNYWASHNGTAMWSDWNREVVKNDLKRLSEEGLQIIRVFPLWTDFQPIHKLYTAGGNFVEYRFGEQLIPNDEAGRAGVSVIAMERFAEFMELAAKYGLKIVVGLITGWMSGRLFVPSALEGKNIITDKSCLLWQIRFVNYFVKKFRNDDNIIAWDMGNECSCMQSNNVSREESWLWTCSIANAIKLADPTRPVISGIHGLSITGNWTIEDQGELTDILVTHPYDFFTPYCDFEGIDTIRQTIHATIQNLYYSDIAGKPCYVEEIGTLGPMVANEQVSAAYLRTTLLSQWAHGCHGMLWWCAFDQTKLDKAPYDWAACEGELGLITEDGRAKAYLKEMVSVKASIDKMKLDPLPKREVQAVCILNTTQDHWATALGSFILAKQAGFDIEFQYEKQPLKDASLYLLPCIKGCNGVNKHFFKEILKKVENGATLYMSIDDGYVLQFAEVTGLIVRTRGKRVGGTKLRVAGEVLDLNSTFKYIFDTKTAEILGTESDGNPAFSYTSYGKGKVFFLSFPLETNLACEPESFTNSETNPYWKIYSLFSENARKTKAISKIHSQVGVTEHPLNEHEIIVVLINYSNSPIETPLTLNGSWELKNILIGHVIKSEDGLIAFFEKNNTIILKLQKI